MDYWPRLKLTVHDDDETFLKHISARRLWLFTSKSPRSYWNANFVDGDCLAFGSETQGLSEAILQRFADRCVRIPQAPDERCLNLSTAAGIALFEALRQIQGN
jgi:tRNA (cytidine/uridine-2'-O-)-methyltransferase